MFVKFKKSNTMNVSLTATLYKEMIKLFCTYTTDPIDQIQLNCLI